MNYFPGAFPQGYLLSIGAIGFVDANYTAIRAMQRFLRNDGGASTIAALFLNH